MSTFNACFLLRIKITQKYSLLTSTFEMQDFGKYYEKWSSCFVPFSIIFSKLLKCKKKYLFGKLLLSAVLPIYTH